MKRACNDGDCCGVVNGARVALIREELGSYANAVACSSCGCLYWNTDMLPLTKKVGSEVKRVYYVDGKIVTEKPALVAS